MCTHHQGNVLHCKHIVGCKSGMSCIVTGLSLPANGVAAAVAPSAGCAAGATTASGAAGAAGAAAGGAGGGRVTPCAARTCTHASTDHAFSSIHHTVQGASIRAEQHAACCEQVRMPKSGDVQAVTTGTSKSMQKRVATPVATHCKLRAVCRCYRLGHARTTMPQAGSTKQCSSRTVSLHRPPRT